MEFTDDETRARAFVEKKIRLVRVSYRVQSADIVERLATIPTVNGRRITAALGSTKRAYACF